MPIHARIKEVKDSLVERGSTTNDELILECADQAGAELESAFIFLISDLPEFDIPSIETANPTDSNKSNLSWFTKLNNKLTELIYLMKTNPTSENKSNLDTFYKETIPDVIKRRFENPPARTR